VVGVRLTRVVLLAALVVGAGASSGAAAAPARAPILGVVPHAGLAPTSGAGAQHALSRSTPFAGSSFLTFDASYESLINRYFTDVAHDSGGTSNVYSVGTQYTDGSGAVEYQSTFGGSYLDHDALPSNGCDDGADAVCLTDAQLQGEIQNVLRTKGWHGSTTTMFFLLTPDGVGSCFDNFSNQCTTNVFCAYHSSFTDSSGEPVIYANEPYDATINGCDPGSSPNTGDGDADLNTISHEHNEAITDPFGDGWWRDSDGEENGDLCAWDFGTKLGGTTGVDAFNQLINGHHYWLQQEWSNNGSGCFQNSTQEGGGTNPGKNLDYHGGLVMHTNTTFAIYWLPTPGNTASPVVTGTAAENHQVTSSTGSWNGSPTGYGYQWQRCSPSGSSCADIPGATAPTYTLRSDDGGRTVRSTVRATNVNGASPYVASGVAAVVPVPSATAAPVLSGVAAVGKKLTTSGGTWNSIVTTAYQWLRCRANGSGCAPIPGATAATYTLVAGDGGHRIEARVTATNAAGTVAALSARSRIVLASPSAKKRPRIAGRARIGKKLSGSRGSWTNSPTGYRYQWLRCNGRGGSCSTIRHATRSTYRPSRHDAGHRLRLRVTAANAAGSRMATSSTTVRVTP